MRTLLLTALSASLIIRFPSPRGWTLNTPNNQLFVVMLGKMYNGCHLVSLSCNSNTYFGDSKGQCSVAMRD